MANKRAREMVTVICPGRLRIRVTPVVGGKAGDLNMEAEDRDEILAALGIDRTLLSEESENRSYADALVQKAHLEGKI